MPSQDTTRRLVAVLGAILFLALFPASVAADADLVRAIPADGATVTEPVTFVSARYSQDLRPGSRLRVVDASGATVATGGMDPEDASVLVARPETPQTSGAFTVQSTILSADDHVSRATWRFNVAVSATPAATPSAASAPSTASATPADTPSAAPSASPTQTADPGAPTSSAGDVLLPIIAALAIAVLGGGFLLGRGRRSGRGS